MILGNRRETYLPNGVAARVERLLTPEPERQLPRDPVAWIRDELDEITWSKQREIARSVTANGLTAVQSCHGIGKSYIAARIAAWWIAAHPLGEAKVVTTAPSGHQVRAILWGELGRAHRRGGLPGSISQGQVPEWKIGGEIVGFGRKPQDYKDPKEAMTQFQGTHARYLLVILDEASGVPEWLWDAVLSLATNENSRMLAIGNPDDPTSRFAKVCAPGSDWNTIQVGYMDTPNFSNERVPEQLREHLIGPTYVERAANEWGVDSPLYTAKVLGLFPDVADDVVITPRMILAAQARSLPGYGRGRLGVDWARKGGDSNVVYRNRDGVIRLETFTDAAGVERPAAWKGTDLTLSKARVRQILDRRGGLIDPIPAVSDVVGLGGGPTDDLRNAGYNVMPFNGGEAARNPRRFTNRRAEAWWALREAFEAGLIDLDPEDLTLAAQLQTLRWREDASGRRIRIETKDELAKRGAKSPDHGDAAVQSNYEMTFVPSASTVLATEDEQRSASLTADLLKMRT